MENGLKYKRILLKLSGESLAGPNGFGIDTTRAEDVANRVKEVHDLGVDVPFAKFAEKAREVNADIVGVSALLTTTMTGQQSVIEALDDLGLRPRVKVIVGGAPVTREWAEKIGADGYSGDALAAVVLAKSLMASKA